MSEDESRAWQRGANSDASQRPFGPPGKRPPSPTGGRGRGRGRGSAPYYDRSEELFLQTILYWTLDEMEENKT